MARIAKGGNIQWQVALPKVTNPARISNPVSRYQSCKMFSLRWEAHGCKVQANGDGWKAQCPAHEDRTPSLSISEKNSGKVLIHCHAGCSYPEIISALGFDQSAASSSPNGETATNGRKRPVPRALPTGPNITTYHYADADAKPAFAVVRQDTPTGKRITQWTPSGDEWLAVGFKGQRPLYRLRELLEWDGKVVIVEGEKCVEAAKTEFPTNFFTTFSGGSAAWKHTDFSPLRGREVTLVADADQGGRDCMLQLAAHLWEIGAGPIKIALPDESDGSDIVEWIEQGIAEKQLKKYLRPWTPNGADTTEETETEETEDVDGRSFSEIEAEQVSWLWKDRIPRSMLTIIDGDPGAGKSQVALDLVSRLTTGRLMPFDDGEALPRKVPY